MYLKLKLEVTQHLNASGEKREFLNPRGNLWKVKEVGGIFSKHWTTVSY